MGVKFTYAFSNFKACHFLQFFSFFATSRRKNMRLNIVVSKFMFFFVTVGWRLKMLGPFSLKIMCLLLVGLLRPYSLDRLLQRDFFWKTCRLTSHGFSTILNLGWFFLQESFLEDGGDDDLWYANAFLPRKGFMLKKREKKESKQPSSRQEAGKPGSRKQAASSKPAAIQKKFWANTFTEICLERRGPFVTSRCFEH